MSTTVSIDEDVYDAAKQIADRSDISVDEVVSRLSRESLLVFGGDAHYRNGIRVLSRRSDAVVTNEDIERVKDAIDEEDLQAALKFRR